jgi:hypothetical protein
MRKAAVLLTGFALLGAAAAGGGTLRGATPVRLQPFRSCAELVDYAKQQAAATGGSGGIVGVPGKFPAPAGAAPSQIGAAPVYSSTNVQEPGVDEPDTVKTDGADLFAVSAGKLYALDTRGARPRLLGSLQLAQGLGHQLLLHGRRLLVLSTSPAVEPGLGRPGGAPYVPHRTILSEIDVTDPAAMRVVRTLTVDGAYLTARLVGATARVVIASTPQLPAVESAGVRSWLPFSVVENPRTGRTAKRALVQCRDVLRPPVFSGLGLVTILTIDLDRGLPPVDSDAVMMGAGTVYASPDRLYVASQRWFPLPAGRILAPPPATTTEIHAFDISKPAKTEYRASGTVSGFVLDQWSLSEHRGYLRVASTESPLWWGLPSPQQSESFVSVLAERGAGLVQVGQVGGLGRGERVYAVRFVGDMGFVVTFRQVDPLYTLDLSEPAHPKVAGELSLLGYSAYLHPVGDGLLLGIGQDATGQGRLLGTQLSLFDVSDPAHPTRLDALPLGSGSSEVEYDAHAFLYWPATAVAVVPVEILPTAGAPAKRPFVGAIAFRIGRQGIAQLGRISHPGGVSVRRSVVVGDRLYTVSDRGVEASSLATLARVAWVPFE